MPQKKECTFVCLPIQDGWICVCVYTFHPAPLPHDRIRPPSLYAESILCSIVLRKWVEGIYCTVYGLRNFIWHIFPVFRPAWTADLFMEVYGGRSIRQFKAFYFGSYIEWKSLDDLEFEREQCFVHAVRNLLVEGKQKRLRMHRMNIFKMLNQQFLKYCFTTFYNAKTALLRNEARYYYP